MKNKYILISGCAFKEEKDMKILTKYANEGWILEDIVGGFFYKLKKGNPQNIIYSIDYQTNADDEYFMIFKEAGWEIVTSIGNEMHIFSAQIGTKPIYSEHNYEIDKYKNIKNKIKKGSCFSLIIAILLMLLLIISANIMRPIFLIILGLLMIDFFVFIFNFITYLSYNYKIKNIKEYKNKKMNIKIERNIYIILGSILLFFGILNLIEKRYSSIFLIILGIFSIIFSIDYHKKYIK